MTPPDDTITQKIQRITIPAKKPKPVIVPDNGRLYSQYIVHGVTHPGLVRPENQDSFAFSISDDGNMMLMLVADGIGGNEGGDIASHYISAMLLREFQKFQQIGIPDNDTAVDFLKSQICLANSALRNLNQNWNIVHPMGTTIALLLLLPESVITAHAGDSRVYCLRDGILYQYTQDHSVINDLLRAGRITPAQVKNHPMNHVISQSMGIRDEVKPDFTVYERRKGDKFLVCSDGLMLHVSDQVIRDIMDESQCARDAVKNLVTRALRGGGGDNVTAVCAYPLH